jgi:toxin FitB
VRFLVDANVLSEATRPRPAASVLQWLLKHESRISVNPIILGELQYGILLLAAGKRRVRLERWFAEGVARLQVLEMDGETGSIWAALLAELKRKGRAMPVKDSLIAATARQHGMTVATRNVHDYRYAGVKVENPFAP